MAAGALHNPAVSLCPEGAAIRGGLGRVDLFTTFRGETVMQAVLFGFAAALRGGLGLAAKGATIAAPACRTIMSRGLADA